MTMHELLIADDKSVAVVKDEVAQLAALAFKSGDKVFGQVDLISITGEEGRIVVGPFLHVGAFTDALSEFLQSISAIDGPLRLKAKTVPASALPPAPSLPEYRSENDPYMPPAFAAGIIGASQEGLDAGLSLVTAVLTFERSYEGSRRDKTPIETYRQANVVSLDYDADIAAVGHAAPKPAEAISQHAPGSAGAKPAVPGYDDGATAFVESLQKANAASVMPPATDAGAAAYSAPKISNGEDELLPKPSEAQVREGIEKIISMPRMDLKPKPKPKPLSSKPPMLSGHSLVKEREANERVFVERPYMQAPPVKTAKADWSRLAVRVVEQRITSEDSLLVVEYRGRRL